jgi:hypothetical protein
MQQERTSEPNIHVNPIVSELKASVIAQVMISSSRQTQSVYSPLDVSSDSLKFDSLYAIENVDCPRQSRMSLKRLAPTVNFHSLLKHYESY